MALGSNGTFTREDDIVEMNMDHPFCFTISNTQCRLKLFEDVYNLK